ncbi:MAG: DNA mismatch repair protein MutS [bacterium]|nr:DNA mismatch repair protein MutS [bacterium]
MPPNNEAKLTPMLRQFYQTKAQYADSILFYRMGDFYEMFGEDAQAASKVLQIQLTARGKGTENQIPMCGVPVHAWESYVNKLTKAGMKVAICEQMEDPSEAKGLVRREVVRVITPGTVLAEDLLVPGQNQYLLSLVYLEKQERMGLAFADLTTGEFELDEVDTKAGLSAFVERYALYRPKEILFPSSHQESYRELLARHIARLPHLEAFDSYHFNEAHSREALAQHFEVLNLDGFGVAPMGLAISAAGGLLAYLKETQKEGLVHFNQIRRVASDRVMVLDEATQANLELFEGQGGVEGHSLLELLDQSQTPMGSRLLRRWLGRPLLVREEIERRLDGVQCFLEEPIATQELRALLKPIGDLERVLARISMSGCNVPDLQRLKRSLEPLAELKALLPRFTSEALSSESQNFDSLSDLQTLLAEQIVEQTGLKLAQGGFIAEGISEKLDELRGLAKNGKQLIANLEAKEKKATGISSLKIGYNRVYGFYLEVSKAAKGQVPEHYIRKQTLVGSERYSTEELSELQEDILSADDQALALELELFESIRQKVIAQIGRIQKTSQRIARLDVFAALAILARERNYRRPEFLPGQATLSLKGARHPVIEAISDEPFTTNDLEMDRQGRIHIITGPNMGGKSTYMRQAALIALMAQIGSYVPADQARLPIFDRVFTRVGASDNLTRGQSTFMVEMSEAASILHNATANSLVILDEIGRGTSTFDGISLAWSIVEYLLGLGSFTLFATHYHELIALEEKMPGIKNAKVVVKEEGEKILFLRKVVAGAADRSYGIQVAQLAGLPKAVVKGAQQVLKGLDFGQHQFSDALGGKTTKSKAAQVAQNQQISFEAAEPAWIDEFRRFDVNAHTPLEAAQFILQLQQKI